MFYKKNHKKARNGQMKSNAEILFSSLFFDGETARKKLDVEDDVELVSLPGGVPALHDILRKLGAPPTNVVLVTAKSKDAIT